MPDEISRSPNIADALTMGVWYLVTQPITMDAQRQFSRQTIMSSSEIKITGAPSLD
jgi:hypothetical protein